MTSENDCTVSSVDPVRNRDQVDCAPITDAHTTLSTLVQVYGQGVTTLLADLSTCDVSPIRMSAQRIVSKSLCGLLDIGVAQDDSFLVAAFPVSYNKRSVQQSLLLPPWTWARLPDFAADVAEL